jgi:hypothetical protein
MAAEAGENLPNRDGDFHYEVVYEVTLANTTPTQAYEAFGNVIWWGGGGVGAPTVITAGDPKTLEGSVRCVPMGIHEAAVKVAYPDSFEYTIVRKSVFPVSAHHGCVTFRPLQGDETTTRVLWTVSYTPYCCMNWLVRIMVACLPFFLSNLKSAVGRDNLSKTKNE